VPGPKQSSDVVKYLGEFGSADECWAACNKSFASVSLQQNLTAADAAHAINGCPGFAYHTPEFAQAEWRRQCYSTTNGDFSAADTGVTSGQPPHSGGAKFTFSTKRGGNQGGEGNDEGGEWFVSNVKEELDAANEFYYDEHAKKLYYIPNGTATPSSDVVVPTLDQLLDIQGTQSKPVKDISIKGITFMANRPTFMEPRTNPSGGDWSLERQGAIRLEGAENVMIQGNLFTKLDSNAISINGYNRGVTIDKNEFVWLGLGAIASWGREPSAASGRALNDGTGGEQPRGTVVTNNFIHEIGHIQKQSSFYFQALTALATINNNIVFNIPRAGINFNDGFGGGAKIFHNLLFNTCRESGDHVSGYSGTSSHK